jgi:hypothetical protein
MRWKAVIEPPKGYPAADLQVVTEILDASKSWRAAVSSRSLTPVDDTGGINAKWPGSSVNDQRFDASVLPDGVYYLRGKLLRSGHNGGGGVLYTYPDYKIVKESPTVQRNGWTAWVDRYNRAVVKGKPTFIWGAFLQPNFANNTYAVGAGDPYASAEAYEAIAISNPPFSADAPTMLKAMLDLKMNTDIYFGNLSAANIGISYNLPAPGTVAVDGTGVLGSGTTFRSQFRGGDVVVVTGLTGTGTVAVSGSIARGTGTRFTAELRPFDWLIVAGRKVLVSEILSDFEAIIAPAQTVASAPFTYDAARTVVEVTSDTSLTVDTAFPVLANQRSYTRSTCSQYTSRLDYLSPYLTAAERYGISHMQIISNLHRRDANLPTWAKYCRVDAGQAVSKLLTHAPTPLPNRAGWLGLYVADEPSAESPTEGLAASFVKLQDLHQTNKTNGKAFGGVHYWVDGPAPTLTWNQWNNIVDASGPDPYPVGFGPLADDVVYGIYSAPLHGRSYWWPRRVADGIFDARPLWTTIQLFQAVKAVGMPKPADQKIQLVSALAAGSTGILWWTMVGNTGLGSVGNAEYYEQWRRGGKVIASVMPVLEQPVADLTGRLDGEPEYGRVLSSVSDPAIKCSSRQLGTQALLACVNTTSSAVHAALKLRGTYTSGRLIWEDTAVPVMRDGISLAFTGLNDPAAPHDAAHLIVLN